MFFLNESIEASHEERVVGELRDDHIGVPLQPHVHAAVLDLAGNGARGVEVRERVTLLLGEGVHRLDAGEFGRGELSEALFGFDHFLLDDFHLLAAGFVEGEGPCIM